MNKNVALVLLLFFAVASFVFPQSQSAEIRLLDAIDEANKEAVLELVEKGVDLESLEYSDETPLFRAVSLGYYDIALILLEHGADPNSESIFGPGPMMGGEGYPLWVALCCQDDRMIELLLSYGADESIAHTFYQMELFGSLKNGNVDIARLLTTEGKASINADNLSMLLLYDSGTEEVRRFVEENGPADINHGVPNLLEWLLDNEVYFDDFQKLPEFPMATSFLSDKNDYFRYAPDKAFDGDVATSWVENMPDNGIGQKIAFILPKELQEILVLPGYGDERYFAANNRVKSARLSIHTMGMYAAQVGVQYVFQNTGLAYDLEFRDAMELQKIIVDLSATGVVLDKWEPKEFLAVFEIRDVYPGEKWDDTCIAEIQFR